MITAQALAQLMENLPTMLRQARVNQSVKEAATDIGMSTSTLHRLEHAYGCEVATLIKVLDWLETTYPPTRER